MKRFERRVNTMKALINGSAINIYTAECNNVLDEYDKVTMCNKVPQLDRRYILMVLHSTRALDTSLKTYLNHNGIRTLTIVRGTRRYNQTACSLGQYLEHFECHNLVSMARLSGSQRHYYKRAIANIRNKYMHEAGAFPNNELEILVLLSDMENCLADILSL